MNPERMTSSEASVYCGLGKGTLAQWRCERKSDMPPFYRVSTRKLFYKQSDLDVWIQSRKETV